MTTIQLITNDQTLIAVVSPKVATGDIDSVLLHVDFDSVWDDFSVRSAVFYTSKDPTKHEVLLTNNECLVPASVLAETGILFMGVRGITADGTAIKTSTIVKYKIVEGASASEMTLYPELDMFQQYLAAIDGKIDPIRTAITESVKKTLAAFQETVNGTLEEKVNKSGGTMTGFLSLFADPTEPMHAVTKQYLDSFASANSGSLPKMKFGTYTGVGAWGEGNENTVTCDFQPHVFILFNKYYIDTANLSSSNFYITVEGNWGYVNKINVTQSGETYTIKWYNNERLWMEESDEEGYGYGVKNDTITGEDENQTNMYAGQGNTSGSTYYYLILGLNE